MIKRNFNILLMFGCVFFVFPRLLLGDNINITKVGEWGTGYYYDVYIQGQYIYCAAGKGGLDIIDISNPSIPKKVGNHDTPGIANALYVEGHYAYVADWERGLQVFDVSDPASPVLAGKYMAPGNVGNVYVKGHHAYVACYDSGLHIVDVSEPSNPTLVGKCNTPGHARGVVVVGNYAYVADGYSGLQIIDVTNLSNPAVVGGYDTSGYSWRVYVSGNYSYIADDEGGMQIIDITNPFAPVYIDGVTTFRCARDVFVRNNYAFVTDIVGRLKVIDISKPSESTVIGNYNTSGSACGIFVNGNLAYVADYDYGLQVLDVSEPTSPNVVGSYNNTLKSADGVDVKGNNAYVVEEGGVVHIVDISNTSSPNRIGKCVFPDPSWSQEAEIRDVHVSGNYAYVAAWSEGLKVIDVSNPSTPTIVGDGGTVGLAYDVYVSGNYAYVGCFSWNAGILSVLNVSNTSNPSRLGYCNTPDRAYGVYVVDNYTYVAAHIDGLQVIDVSNPSAPNIVGNCETPEPATGVFVVGNYAYVVGRSGLHIIDVSNPSLPNIVGNCEIPESALSVLRVYVADNYAYVANEDEGLQVIDVSNPYAPALVGSYDTPGSATEVYVKGNHVYVADGYSGKLIILQIDKYSTSPRIRLYRSELNFASDNSGAATPAQSLFITNSGGGSLEWTAAANQDWLNYSPRSGTDNGEILISINSTGLLKGTYKGTITISATNASNSPQTVEVTLKVFGTGQTSLPFGVYATPANGADVSGSVPVTGWALDDIGVEGVQIFREENSQLVYVGDAVMVEGARPDVEQAYSGYPMNYKAGWGYMMLTNFLPDGGNGAFKIHAVATDLEGNQVTLGTKTIICDNANAVEPFGTIDTPEQGGIASGSNFVNYGWVLTPLPNTIPTDGSTIRVWVDGVSVGNPVYNQYRADIANLFPGYNNSDGAVGYFYLDTTQYENGVHTIQWTAADDEGNTDGIGSRYFTIQNTAGRSSQHTAQRAERVEGRKRACLFRDSIQDIPIDHSRPVRIRKGYDNTEPYDEISTDEKGVINVEIKELERFEIHFFEPGHKNSILKVNRLPIGSTLDAEEGIFSWQPGPGFIGEYRFVFISADQQGHKTRRDVRVIIRQKF